MLSVYDGNGARFQRHIDNTARDGRRLTVLCYLNADWKMEDGGALQIFPISKQKRNTAKVESESHASHVRLPSCKQTLSSVTSSDTNKEKHTQKNATSDSINCANVTATAYPLAARLALFFAESVPHAVMPTFAPRYALTVWYYDAEERRESMMIAKKNAQITKTQTKASAENRTAVCLQCVIQPLCCHMCCHKKHL